MTQPVGAAADAPHSKYPHVYAVLRLDPGDAPLEQQVTVIKVMRGRDEAEREVERLNALNSSKGCKYVVQITRLIDSGGESVVGGS
jgi:hypothetical protein